MQPTITAESGHVVNSVEHKLNGNIRGLTSSACRENPTIDPNILPTNSELRNKLSHLQSTPISSKNSEDYQLPRSYQQLLFEQAKENNVIAVLNTGTGKTLVSVLLMRHIVAAAISDEGPRKCMIFVVPTIPLVCQQAWYIRANSPLNVAYFWGGNGDRNSASRESWTAIFSKADVIVLTAGMLLSLLDKGVVAITSISLIIFDECHHTKKDHPYNLVMRNHYHRCSVESRPKIFGMTASPVAANTEASKAIM